MSMIMSKKVAEDSSISQMVAQLDAATKKIEGLSAKEAQFKKSVRDLEEKNRNLEGDIRLACPKEPSPELIAAFRRFLDAERKASAIIKYAYS